MRRVRLIRLIEIVVTIPTTLTNNVHRYYDLHKMLSLVMPINDFPCLLFSNKYFRYLNSIKISKVPNTLDCVCVCGTITCVMKSFFTHVFVVSPGSVIKLW